MMEQKTRSLKIIFTTDIHGNYFPFDFKHERWGKGSLQRVHAYVAQQCCHHNGGVVLMDGGDILQGEPTAYYFNYVNPGKRHKVADMCNFIGYDVGVIGNHDIETGHETFDSFIDGCNYPILGANAISVETGAPYFEPYTILYRAGIKIAVVGFITPAIPHWIPRRIWQDIRFEDIKESATKWIDFIRKNERVDYIVGLFHSGMDEGICTPDYKENATRETAAEVEGFDLILYGHDHTSNMEEIDNPAGEKILCINPGSHANSVAEIDVQFTIDAEGIVTDKQTKGKIVYIGTMHNQHATEFKRHFHHDFNAVKRFANERVGRFLAGINICDAYFGPSAYIDLIHRLQLHVSQADISFAAPLFFNASIDAGEVKISNLFNLYRFEDRLYSVKLQGREIKNYLEMSYGAWVNQMTSPDDEMLQLAPMKCNPDRMGFKNFLFNFDSAAGICYDVDLRKAEGEKICIKCMADGSPFDMDKYYTVAVTAYRANGGGELLTKGAGLTKDEIEQRIVKYTERDIRYHLMTFIKNEKDILPSAHNKWRFIPQEWAEAASMRERKLLFDVNSN